MINKDISLIAVELLLAGLLFWIAGHSKKYLSSYWKIVYVAPFLLVLFMLAYTGYERTMLGAYIGAVIIGIGFFSDKAGLRRLVCCIAAATTIFSVPVSLNSKAYRKPDFLTSFEEGFAEMKQRYVLTEHKKLDWDALYAKYRPQFKQIQHDHDEIANYTAWMKFCAEFHDAHVNYIPKDDDVMDKTFDKIMGNDYGLVLLSLDDGRTVAVNVSAELKKNGIHNGIVITSWDGMTPEEANTKSEAYGTLSFSDIDNEYFYRTSLAAGVGGDTVEVTYIDDNGDEQKTTLTACGSFYERWEEAVMDKLNAGVDIGHLEWKKLSDDTHCLRIKTMAYDNKTYSGTDYSEMKNQIKDYILQKKANGLKNIVIDIRTNNGGSPYLCEAIAELVAPEGEYFHCYDAEWDDLKKCYKRDENGNYVKGAKLTIKGEDILDGGKIILLVNNYSVSAADDMTMLLMKIPNATVMGFTEPCGVCQAVTGFSVDSGIISLSSCVLLDEDGSIFVDAGPDGQAATDLDIRVPFDEAAVKAIFDNGEDYLLDKALEQLS